MHIQCSIAAAVLAVISIGCTSRNSAYCGDGICTDPARPFCDVDGTVGGQASTCIAVSCAPSAFKSCRGDTALVCNGDGSNYEVTTCEHGCDDSAGGCVGCLDDTQCMNPAPHCDMVDHTCKGCVVDDDCASAVCDDGSGMCVDAATVVYADPNGSIAGTCGAKTMPCVVERAFTQLDATHTIVKLAAGDYTPQPITVHATGTVHGFGAMLHTKLTIGSSANLKLIGLTSDSTSGFGIDCNAVDAATATAVLDRVFAKSGVNVSRCAMTVSRSHVLAVGGHAIFVINDVGTSLTIDRALFETSDTFQDAVYLDGLAIHVSNSVFRGFQPPFSQGGVAPGSVEFSTFIDSPIDASGRATYSNNILYSSNFHDVISSPSTNENRFHNNQINTQGALPSNSDATVSGDPVFKDAAHGDFHLALGSPAIDAADPTATIPVDFDGTSRPNGPRRDIGAFEFH